MTQLLAARLKLSRAREHLFALNAEDQQFWLGRPGNFDIAYDQAAAQYIVTWARFNPPPSRLGLLVGDFAQNARAALDHAIFELSRGPQRQEPTGTSFPIVNTEEAFRKEGGRPIQGLCTNVRA